MSSAGQQKARRRKGPLDRRQVDRGQIDRGQSAGFDFTLHLRRLCDDMVARVEQFDHVDMTRVAIGFSQTRKATHHGMYASLTPMRFAGGQPCMIRQGQKWAVQRLHDANGREVLYILSFYLPRFLNLTFREKLTTVMHELWHIGPKFDGDVRRYRGRCFAHGSSQERYDVHVDRLVDQWLRGKPPETIYEFLRLNFHQLVADHGRVYGRKIPTPKLFPVQ